MENGLEEGRGTDVKRTLGIRPQIGWEGVCEMQDVGWWGKGKRALARPRRLI